MLFGTEKECWLATFMGGFIFSSNVYFKKVPWVLLEEIFFHDGWCIQNKKGWKTDNKMGTYGI